MTWHEAARRQPQQDQEAGGSLVERRGRQKALRLIRRPPCASEAQRPENLIGPRVSDRCLAKRSATPVAG